MSQQPMHELSQGIQNRGGTRTSLKRQRSTSKKVTAAGRSSSKLLSKKEEKVARQQNREILSENMQA